MKYCYHCDRVTVGEPLFCNFCGRSYDAKLCPKLHANPRGTHTCSQCGSTELSTPQPRVSIWVKVLLSSITVLVKLLIIVVSIGLIMFVIEHRVEMAPAGMTVIGFVGGVLGWGWTEIPLYSRRTVRRWLQSNGKGDRSD